MTTEGLPEGEVVVVRVFVKITPEVQGPSIGPTTPFRSTGETDTPSEWLFWDLWDRTKSERKEKMEKERVKPLELKVGLRRWQSQASKKDSLVFSFQFYNQRIISFY